MRQELSNFGIIENLLIPRPPYLQRQKRPEEDEKMGIDDFVAPDEEAGQLSSKTNEMRLLLKKKLEFSDPQKQVDEFGTYFINRHYGGAGHFFVKFSETQHAEKCISEMHKRRTYLGREVHAYLFDEEKYRIEWHN